ncbi:MAG: hypothetical protein G8D89_16465 [gamma proteobacterium symbiont of Clathrolucina costata]
MKRLSEEEIKKSKEIGVRMAKWHINRHLFNYAKKSYSLNELMSSESIFDDYISFSQCAAKELEKAGLLDRVPEFSYGYEKLLAFKMLEKEYEREMKKLLRESLRVYLDVPFEEKDLVKLLGAKWDRRRKRWYVPEDVNLDPFRIWVNRVL